MVCIAHFFLKTHSLKKDATFVCWCLLIVIVDGKEKGTFYRLILHLALLVYWSKYKTPMNVVNMDIAFGNAFCSFYAPLKCISVHVTFKLAPWAF
jgi:hypothetical protein